MANARLMQQTLAQFEIEVALGDITKGPTITRYELHPAPGVKLEKITALNNNLAAALKAERIHILAPVPGKSSVGVEVPNPVKTIRHHPRPARLRRLAQHQSPHPAGAGQGRLRPPHHRRPVGNAAPAHRRQHRLGQIRLHQRHHYFAALPLLTRPAPLRDDRPEGGRAAAIQHPAPPGRPGRHRPEEGHSRPALGGQRDGEALPDLRPRRRPQYPFLQLAPQEQAPAAPRTRTPAPGQEGEGRARRRRLRRGSGRGNRRPARGRHRHPREAQLHRGHHRRARPT